jgi:hypothetical protein
MLPKQLLTAALLFLVCPLIQAQTGYSNAHQQANRLNSMAKSYPQLAKLQSIAKTVGGKDIWLLTIGTGNTDSKPAIAVVGGVEGNHLLGTELALSFAEQLLKSSSTDSIKNLLNKTSFYVFPNMSPDAMEQYFAPLKYERKGNAAITDDDRDGRPNEDGYEDLDGNGKITIMRVESPIGDYKVSADDSRILIKADLTQGEKGNYLIFTEGIDNDKDGKLNEDGEGGVWFNKNLTFKHQSFSQGAGEFPVSENETRALLDKLYALFNVYAVVSFSNNNNLSNPFTSAPPTPGTRIVTNYLDADAKVNTMASDLYNKTAQLKDAPKVTPQGGDFLSWAYFAYGRFSFSTPGWVVPKAKADTTKNAKPITATDSASNYIRWAAQQGLPDEFTPWKKITHPDFPGQVVEVGGLDPFALINPPYKYVDSICQSHTNFIVKLATLQPEIDIINVKTEKLAGGITRITATIVNKGALPTHSKLGERNYWVKRIGLRLGLAGNQLLISGKKIQALNALEGFGSQEISWLVKGSGSVTLEAGSPTTGTKKTDVRLN